MVKNHTYIRQLYGFYSRIRILFKSWETRLTARVVLGDVKLLVKEPIVSDHVRKRLISGKYEVGESALIEEYLSPQDIVMELGAGLGYISIKCAKVVGWQNVFSYEANPTMISLIRKNFELNGFSECNISNKILVNNNGSSDTIPFFIHENFYSSSVLSETSRKVNVETAKFESELLKTRCSFLVMDIEGYEYFLMKDAKLPSNLTKICIELHPGKVDGEIREDFDLALKNKGFNMVRSHGEVYIYAR